MTSHDAAVLVTGDAEAAVGGRSAGGGRRWDKASKKCSRWGRNHLGPRRWRQAVAVTGATEKKESEWTQICSSGAGPRAGCRAAASQPSNRQGLVGRAGGGGARLWTCGIVKVAWIG